MAAEEEVKDRDLVLSMMGEFGHEYDFVVTLVSSKKKSMTVEEAQFLFLMHEQRIDQLNSSAQLNLTGAFAHFAANNSGRGHNFGGFGGNNNHNNNNYNTQNCGNSNNRGRGGRFGNRSGQRIYCQVCSKPGHGALKCFKRFDQEFKGPNQANLVQQQEGSGQMANSGPASNTNQMSQANYHQSLSAYFATPETVNDQAWYIDSGATNHVTANLKNLSIKSDDKGPYYEEGSSSRYT